jgi:hypothetical protein
MGCLACDYATQLKKIGIDASCEISLCKNLKEEPSFSTVRQRIKGLKEKIPRKESCFNHITPMKKIRIDMEEDGTVKETKTNKKKFVEPPVPVPLKKSMIKALDEVKVQMDNFVQESKEKTNKELDKALAFLTKEKPKKEVNKTYGDILKDMPDFLK